MRAFDRDCPIGDGCERAGEHDDLFANIGLMFHSMMAQLDEASGSDDDCSWPPDHSPQVNPTDAILHSLASSGLLLIAKKQKSKTSKSWKLAVCSTPKYKLDQ